MSYYVSACKSNQNKTRPAHGATDRISYVLPIPRSEYDIYYLLLLDDSR